jgi:hypothetical protein
VQRPDRRWRSSCAGRYRGGERRRRRRCHGGLTTTDVQVRAACRRRVERPARVGRASRIGEPNLSTRTRVNPRGRPRARHPKPCLRTLSMQPSGGMHGVRHPSVLHSRLRQRVPEQPRADHHLELRQRHVLRRRLCRSGHRPRCGPLQSIGRLAPSCALEEHRRGLRLRDRPRERSMPERRRVHPERGRRDQRSNLHCARRRARLPARPVQRPYPRPRRPDRHPELQPLRVRIGQRDMLGRNDNVLQQHRLHPGDRNGSHPGRVRRHQSERRTREREGHDPIASVGRRLPTERRRRHRRRRHHRAAMDGVLPALTAARSAGPEERLEPARERAVSSGGRRSFDDARSRPWHLGHVWTSTSNVRRDSRPSYPR